MSMAVVDMREDKISNIGRGNIDGVPHDGKATAALMDSYLSPAEYRPTKKRPVQNIRDEIRTTPTVSLGHIFGRGIAAADRGGGGYS